MFRSIILSIALVLGFSSISFANEVDLTKAYRVVHNQSAEILSWISFEPVIEWVGGNPYVAMKEYDSEGRQHMNLYPYTEIFLEPIDPNTIIR